MAFTTATVSKIHADRFQFNGAFSEMFAVTLTVDPSSIAAGAEDSATFTVKGLLTSDMVLGVTAGEDLTNSGEASYDVWVSAADTLKIRITNLHATNAVDLASSTWRVLVGRPTWS